jgi:general secretion pathway protein G
VDKCILKSTSETREEKKFCSSFAPSFAHALTKYKKRKGFTLIEVLLVVAILATLLVVAMPGFQRMADRARISQARSDIAMMGNKITDNFVDYGQYPETLEELDFSKLHDPYGFAYEYLLIFGKKKNEIQGKWRKDRFLVPLNYDFDLYSVGKDGKSVAPLTAKASHDDIIRANNGRFIDLASKY